MTDLDLTPIADRLEQISQELRRHGRAAVAAQAAAESCLSSVEQLAEQLSQGHSEPDASDEQCATATLKSLLPLFDALLRVAKEAEALEPVKPTAWPLSLTARDKNVDRLQTLRHGVRLLDGAFRQAMDNLGIVVEQGVGIELDSDLHRIVKACNPTHSHPPDTVVEVVRCGYIRDGSILREADVIATRSRSND